MDTAQRKQGSLYRGAGPLYRMAAAFGEPRGSQGLVWIYGSHFDIAVASLRGLIVWSSLLNGGDSGLWSTISWIGGSSP